MLVDKYSNYNNNIYYVSTAHYRQFERYKMKKQSFVSILHFEILLSTYDQAIPTALILLSSFTPEKSSLILSAGFRCRTNCSGYWLKVAIYLGHSSLPCISGQLAEELLTR